MSTDSRKYELKIRAERQRQTRKRIVAATVALHREVGPAQTTIADIARRARVQRLTVYNHFPELGDLLAACQGQFLGANPPPDIAPGPVTRKEAVPRLEAALAGLYAWFRANEPMQRNIHRDRQVVPELDRLLRENADSRFEGAAAAYARLIGATPSSVASVRRMVAVALRFGTWQLLAADGMSDRAMAKLLARAVKAVA